MIDYSTIFFFFFKWIVKHQCSSSTFSGDYFWEISKLSFRFLFESKLQLLSKEYSIQYLSRIRFYSCNWNWNQYKKKNLAGRLQNQSELTERGHIFIELELQIKRAWHGLVFTKPNETMELLYLDKNKSTYLSYFILLNFRWGGKDCPSIWVWFSFSWKATKTKDGAYLSPSLN